jgi:acyl-CoA synthetase (AMP-forming)/AMP-acid ligase II
MSLLNTRTGYTTPWHCGVALLANGEWVSAPVGDFKNDPRLEIIYEDGRPSYFKEKACEDSSNRISETSATYLQAPKQISGSSSGYSSPSVTPGISGHSTPVTSARSSPRIAPSLSSVDVALTKRAMKKATTTPYGRRLIPQIMESLASAEPDRVVFQVASFSDNGPAFRNISARTFMKAVDKTAWWLREQVGTPSSIEPVGYIGPHDLRHILLTYACVKAGCAALFLSPKNSTDGALAVLEATNCNIWAKAGEVDTLPLVLDVLEQRKMTLLELPLLDELLDAESTKPFPYTKTFDEAGHEPFCFLHTSGSTGVPKPIPWSHALIGTMDAIRLLPPVEGDGGLVPWTSDWKEDSRIYSSFPMCHGAGIIMNILLPALFKLHCVLGPVGVLPNISLMENLADHANIDIWSMVPSLVDELGDTPEVLEKLKSSRFICASGGECYILLLNL